MAQKHSRSSQRARAGILALASLLAPASAASAGPIGYTQRLATQLNRIDLTTLDLDPIGDLSGVRAIHHAFHADGTLYGLAPVTTTWLQLTSFDLTTGAGRVVADLHLEFEFFASGFAGDADGRLWALGVLPDREEFPLVILSIDPVAGAVGEPVEIVGPVEFPAALAACGDLLVTSGASGLVAIDPISGETAVLLPNAPPASDMDRGPDGAMWTVKTGDILYGDPTVIHRLDLATGERTVVGEVQLGTFALAIAPPTGGPCLVDAPLAIPTLSPLGLVALAVSIAGAALRITRRRSARVFSAFTPPAAPGSTPPAPAPPPRAAR